MGLHHAIAELQAEYPDIELREPARRWQRPSTSAEILQRIDRSQVAELVFHVDVWDKQLRSHKRAHQLTLAGAVEAACAMGGIVCGQPVWSIGEGDIGCDVPAHDLLTGVTVWGTSSASLTIEYEDGKTKQRVTRSNDNARAIALGKAQRNAIANLIPSDLQQSLFGWYEEQSKPQPQRQAKPAPKPEPSKRLPREEHLKLVRTAGDSAVLAETWRAVRRDRHDADAELMYVAFELCKEFLSAAATVADWNRVVADVKSIGFAGDAELAEAIRLRREAIRAERDDGGELPEVAS